jgi:hypothetical protein
MVFFNTSSRHTSGQIEAKVKNSQNTSRRFPVPVRTGYLHDTVQIRTVTTTLP